MCSRSRHMPLTRRSAWPLTLKLVLDARVRLLVTALGCASLRDAPCDAALDRLHRWLDSCQASAIADTARQGYDLELRRYDGRGWRAILFHSGFEHSLASRMGRHTRRHRADPRTLPGSRLVGLSYNSRDVDVRLGL